MSQNKINLRELWPEPPPSADFTHTVISRALAHKQQRPWWLAPALALQESFTNWRYGLAYKCAGLALCALLGLASGAYQPNYDMMGDDDVLFFDSDMAGDI